MINEPLQRATAADPAARTRDSRFRQDFLEAVRSGHPDRIEASLDRISAEAVKWPGLPQLHQVLNALPMPMAIAISQRLTSRWGQLVELRAAAANRRLGPGDALLPASTPLQSLLLTAISHGHAAALEELALKHQPRWHHDAGNDEIARMVQAMPEPGALRRPLIVDDGSDVVQSEPADLATTAIVFTGLADRVAFDLPVFDALLAARGINAIYLRDHSRKLFLDGVGMLGPDRESTRVALHRMLDRAGAGRVVCIGSSAGGFAAIDWACDLGAGHAIGISAPTNASRAFAESIGDRRAATLLRRVTAEHSPARLDLRPKLAAAGSGLGVSLHFGQDMVQDRAHAQALAALPQVRLCPVAGYAGHDVLYPITWSGGLDALLAPCGTRATT